MLFKPELLAKVLNGEKTQTRRIAKPDEEYIFPYGGRQPRIMNLRGDKWVVGRLYAACPGRGKVQQGKIKITDIHWDVLLGISEADARAEGFASRDEFLEAWDNINGKGKRNVMVWVIEFEVVA